MKIKYFLTIALLFATCVYLSAQDDVNCTSGIPFWGIQGNNNIKTECHFIGTVNNVDVIFKTNNIERMRMLATGKSIFKDSVLIESNLNTRSLTMPVGARKNFILVSDAQGKAAWQASATVADADTTNELQTLKKTGNQITLSKNGGVVTDEVNDADHDPVNELQTLTRAGNTVTLSQNGGSFEDKIDDADHDPTNEIQTLTRAGNTVTLSQNGGSFEDKIDDADHDPANEIQTLTRAGNTVTLSQNGGSFEDKIDDADHDPVNELQKLTRAGNTVTLSQNGGSFEDKIDDADHDPANEIQKLTRNGNTVTLSQDGGFFELNDGDGDPTNELQVLTKAGNRLTLSGNGGSIDLNDGDADPANELQQLSLNEQTKVLSLSNGNSVNMSGILSNHWTLLAGNNLMSGVSGNVGIGASTPAQKLDVAGAIGVGNTTVGTRGAIRWNGSDFQGFDGTVWKSFTETGSSASGAATWLKNGSRIFYTEGAVGVGINKPLAQLDVAGSQRISDNLGIGIVPTLPLDIGAPGRFTNPVAPIDQKNETGNVDADHFVDILWQSFTPAVSGALTSISVFGHACGHIQHTGDANIGVCGGLGFNLEIFEGEGVDGTLLRTASGSLNTGMNLSISEWMPFVIPDATTNPIQLTAGKKYTFKFQLPISMTNATVKLSRDNPYSGGKGFITFDDVNDNNTDLLFRVAVNGSFEGIRHDMVVDRDGKVGIGTDSPASKLDVRGKVIAEALETPAFSLTKSPGDGFLMVSDTAGKASWQSPTSINFQRAGDWRIGTGAVFLQGDPTRQLATPKVGIGTNTPSHALDILEGNELTASLRLQSQLNDGQILFEKLGSQPANNTQARIGYNGSSLSFSNSPNNKPSISIFRSNAIAMDGGVDKTGGVKFAPAALTNEAGDGYVRIFAPKESLKQQAFFVGVNGTPNFMSVEMDGQVKINGKPTITDFKNTKAYPLLVSGGQHGIAVKIDGPTFSAANNYMTYFRGSEIAGRIEGFNVETDWQPPALDITDPTEFICYLQEMLGGVPPPDGPSLALLPISIALSNACKHGGVSYASGNGDYAEYLEKEDPAEKLLFGDVVGVKAGKISKNTEGAEQVMSISLAPIVLGNMPPHDSLTYKYAKVGFMGQVPVKVKGPVNSGDYIVASGNNDGIGIAVTPKALTIEDMSRIIGRSFMTSAYEGTTFITVVVGVKSNEWVEILKNHQQKIADLEAQVTSLTALKKENEQMRADINQIMQVIGIQDGTKADGKK